MSYYDDVYRKRLNRFGTDYASRVQGQREKEFENYLATTVYKVTFTYNSVSYVGALEPSKQDYTQTINYLLVDRDLNLPAGTLLAIPDKDNVSVQWMVWWMDNYKASGYNRYTMLKMSHQISWTTNGTAHSQYGYFYGSGKSMIESSIVSNKTQTVFHENKNKQMFITPRDASIVIGTYFEITEGGITTAYEVVGRDLHSTPGVEYVSVDAMHRKDLTPAPTPGPGESPSDPEFYWITGGGANGSS